MNLFCIDIVGTAASLLAGQLVGVHVGRAEFLNKLTHHQDVATVRLKRFQQLLRRSKAAEGGPVKTRVLTKSVTSANKEAPLYHCDVEFSLFVWRGGDFVNEKHRRGLTVWDNLIGHFWIISSALCCRISFLCVIPG